jgi:hypothetical protein
VSPTLCLLTAALLTGQSPGCNCGASAAAASGQQVSVYEMPQERPGLFPRLAHRLHNLFGGDENDSVGPIQGRFEVVPQTVQTMPQSGAFEEQSAEPMVSGAEPPLAGKANVSASTTIKVTDSQGQSQAVETLNGEVPSGTQVISGPLPPGVQVIEENAKPLPAQAGHDADYHHITGRLCFLPSGGGTWLIHYGDNDQDRYNGLLELSTSASMNGLRSGDLVSVEGDVVGGGTDPDAQQPLFHAHSVRLIEHVQ